MLQIPLQSVPSQQLQVVLGLQNCQIAVYQNAYGLFFDLNSNGVDIAVGVIALNIVPLNPRDYAGFAGNLIFIDTQGTSDPTYDGLGGRYQLIYLTAEDYANFLLK